MKKRIAAVVLTIIMVIGIIFSITGKTQAKNDEVRTLEEINMIASIKSDQIRFEEVMNYLDQNYPERTVGQEIELLKKFYPTEEVIELNLCNSPNEDVEIQTEKVTVKQEEVKEVVQEASDERLRCTRPWFYEYTWGEVLMLACAIWSEAEEYCDDPKDGEYVAKLVASVIVNRMMSEKFSNTISGVIHQGMGTKSQQYGGRTIRMVDNADATSIDPKVLVWAEDILRDGPLGPENLVFQANFPQGKTYFTYGKLFFGTADL